MATTTVDDQIKMFFDAQVFYRTQRYDLANELISQLRKEYPNSLRVLIWYAKTINNSTIASHVILKAYQRDPENLEIIQAYSELNKKYGWVK